MQRLLSSWRQIGLVSMAAVALAIGVLIYLMDRPAGSASLLVWIDHATATFGRWPASAAAGAAPAAAVFGTAGAWLPSLVHAFAFSVLTCLALPPSTRNAAWACGFWAVVETVFEAGQHPAIAPPLVQAIGDRMDAIPVFDHLGRYLANGSFDAADVAAGLAGVGLAFVAVVALHSPQEEP